MKTNTIKKPLNSRQTFWKNNLPFILLSLPAIIYLIMFHYVPIFGVILAFKDFSYQRGIFASNWIGLDNFKYFFESNDVYTVIFNTLAYNIWFHILATICAVIIALMLFEVTNKHMIKYFQTTMAIPGMISAAVIAYIVYALLSYDNGMVNHFLSQLGIDSISWYNAPKWWPLVLSIVRIWWGVGMDCIIYYAVLMGVDSALFEAASLDGANRFKQILCVSLPQLVPIICIKSILAMGSVMAGNLGLFYQVPMNSAALYSATDILDTYVLRGIQSGNIGVSSAVGLFQSLIGSFLLITTNSIIKRVSPDNSMF